MSRLIALRAAQNLHDVARLLNFTPKGLAYILYVKPKSSWYHEFEIDKKSGGKRKISAPDDDLLNLQKRLSNMLQTCDSEIRTALKLKRTIAHGFVPDKSIMTNAQTHLSRRLVLNVDIEDFFGSINFGRVRGFFIKNRSFALNADVATILAQIVCYDNKLPQGAPTSPVVSNLLTHILDVKLAQLSSKVGCTYTRYADDLTFSTNLRTFPPELAILAPGEQHIWAAGPVLKAAVEKQGFLLNEKKTRLQYRSSRQVVTGLVINKKVSVPNEYHRHLRQMVRRLCSTHTVKFSPGREPIPADGPVMNKLHGMLSYVYLVKNFELSRSLAQKNQTISINNAFAKLYARFLVYKDFFSAERPVFLMEGKTDNIYLWCAIRQLAAQLPALATASEDGKLNIIPRLFKNSKTTGELLGLSGGTGGLANFLGIYCDVVKRFGAPKSQNPIILLIDNDDGAKAIYSFLVKMNNPKGKGKKSDSANGKKAADDIDGMQPFYRLGDHIYIVPTPKPDPKAKTCMEHLFSEETRGTVIDGKTFNIHEDGDGSTDYGKFTFAKMIKAKEKTTDFSGFLPYLTITDHIVASHGKAAPTAPAPTPPVVT